LFDFTEQITLMAWVNQRDAANGESNEWISKGDYAWCLKHRQDPFYEFFIYNGSWYVCRVDDAEEIASHVDEWHHFAGTYDGFTISIYVDGELRNTAEHEGFIDITQDPVYLGTNSSYLDRGFNGFLDEVCIYSVALDENQIRAVYETSLSEVAQGSKQVSEFYLRQNYPNPFNPTTQITYSLPRTSEVKLQVFDMLGRDVATLVDGVQLQGEHTVSFQAGDLPSGIYFCKLQSGNQFTDMKKMMLVR
ncbi:MAG: T9SS C-terminal target domain-containing protein, partial [Calditrichaeota bacterium]